MERCHLEPINFSRGSDFKSRIVVGELPPMEFGVVQLYRYTENTAITFPVNTYSCKNSNIANNTCYTQFLVSVIKNQTGKLTKVSTFPKFKPFNQLFVSIGYLIDVIVSTPNKRNILLTERAETPSILHSAATFSKASLLG